MKRKLLIGGGLLVLVAGATAVTYARGRDNAVEVRLEEVGRRSLEATVTASGNIRARRTVSLSSDVSARVSQLSVKEGDEVVQGQVLLRLDPAQLDAAVARAEAALSQARAQQTNQRANLLRAQRDQERLTALRASSLVSQQEIDDAQTALEVATANLESSGFGVQQAVASLDEARDRLSKTILRAPMTGKITRLNIEEGETAVIGTMNNPGSLLMTISDLSVVEVVVQVDETEVPNLSIGDSARIQIDAFPREVFTGRVTEIGHSAIRPPSSSVGAQQAAVDFQVVITLDDTSVPLRPDLSATVDIVTDVRVNVVAVPIIALTVRVPTAAEAAVLEDRAANGAAFDPSEEVEGVFLAQGGRVVFRPVTLGIPGADYFEVTSGLQVGDTVVAGPYQTIRNLKNGAAIKPDAASASAANRAATGG